MTYTKQEVLDLVRAELAENYKFAEGEKITGELYTILGIVGSALDRKLVFQKPKEASDYWYYFGGCTPAPIQIDKGTLPRAPFKKFDTKEDCQSYIDGLKIEIPVISTLEEKQRVFALTTTRIHLGERIDCKIHNRLEWYCTAECEGTDAHVKLPINLYGPESNSNTKTSRYDAEKFDISHHDESPQYIIPTCPEHDQSKWKCYYDPPHGTYLHFKRSEEQ